MVNIGIGESRIDTQEDQVDVKDGIIEIIQNLPMDPLVVPVRRSTVRVIGIVKEKVAPCPSPSLRTDIFPP